MDTGREKVNAAELIQSIAEAALHNQKTIARSTGVLNSAIEELRGETSSYIADRVKLAVVNEVGKIVSEAATRVASEVTQKLTLANKEAERAAIAYKQAAEAASTRVTTIAAVIAIACSVIVSLILLRFR